MISPHGAEHNHSTQDIPHGTHDFPTVLNTPTVLCTPMVLHTHYTGWLYENKKICCIFDEYASM